MLTSTFCHIRGVGEIKERRLWQAGVTSWDAFLADEMPIPRRKAVALVAGVGDSRRALANDDPQFFYERLPTKQHWRMFPHFRRATAYLDIETTGMSPPHDTITTIALYDGQTVKTYVQGRNLEEFVRDIRLYRVLVTYNGKSFDVPFIEQSFGIKLDHVHLDLCHILRSLGYHGGLKGCEKRLGLDRGELDGVDGYFAVLLWRDFRANRNANALETLLAYNAQDVLNLEALMAIAYNEKLMQTPFHGAYATPIPAVRANPFRADAATLTRIRAGTGAWRDFGAHA